MATKVYLAKKTDLENVKTDVTNEETRALAAEQEIKDNVSALSGVVKVQVVSSQPESPTVNTIYYIGTSNPYTIKLYTDTGWTDLGTSSVDLSGYVKTTDNQTITGTKNFTGALQYNGNKVVSAPAGSFELPLSTQSTGLSFSPASGFECTSWATKQCAYTYLSDNVVAITFRVKFLKAQSLPKGDYWTLGYFKWNGNDLNTDGQQWWSYASFQAVNVGSATGVYSGTTAHIGPTGAFYVSNAEKETISTVANTSGIYTTIIAQIKK